MALFGVFFWSPTSRGIKGFVKQIQMHYGYQLKESLAMERCYCSATFVSCTAVIPHILYTVLQPPAMSLFGLPTKSMEFYSSTAELNTYLLMSYSTLRTRYVLFTHIVNELGRTYHILPYNHWRSRPQRPVACLMCIAGRRFILMTFSSTYEISPRCPTQLSPPRPGVCDLTERLECPKTRNASRRSASRSPLPALPTNEWPRPADHTASQYSDPAALL